MEFIENTDSEEINRKLKNYLIKSAKNLYQSEKNDKKSTPMTKNPYKWWKIRTKIDYFPLFLAYGKIGTDFCERSFLPGKPTDFRKSHQATLQFSNFQKQNYSKT